MLNVGLVEHVAPGALHNSAKCGPYAPKCHPEMRKAVQEEIMGWIRHGNQDDTTKRILWLSGPAGSGKTAIAGTIADECHGEGLLAASFFFSAFSGSINRRSKKSFIFTLAYGLLQQKTIVNLKQAILSAIEDDPAVFDKHLDQQLDQLILTPLRAVIGQSDQARWPKVVLVDGVDECGVDGESDRSKQDIRRSREATHKEILSVLARASADPSFPFRILVVSRPEPAIVEFFQSSSELTRRLFLDDKYNPHADIHLFLTAKLGAIQRKFNLPCDWAPRITVDLLVNRASGQFIYATTVIRFVEDTSRPPHEQLAHIVEWKRPSNPESTPFALLDALYHGILESSPNPSLAVKWLVCFGIRWDFAIRSRTGVRAPDSFKMAVLESFLGETTYILGGLSSLISLTKNSGGLEVSLYHQFLLDFLGDERRSGSLHVNQDDAKRHIEDCHYQILKSEPYANQQCNRISAQPTAK